jgi:hypothetical protein
MYRLKLFAISRLFAAKNKQTNKKLKSNHQQSVPQPFANATGMMNLKQRPHFEFTF